MRTFSRLLLIWLPVVIGLLIAVTGLLDGSVLLIIAGIASAAVSALLGAFLSSGWRAQDEARPKKH